MSVEEQIAQIARENQAVTELQTLVKRLEQRGLTQIAAAVDAQFHSLAGRLIDREIRRARVLEWIEQTSLEIIDLIEKLGR